MKIVVLDGYTLNPGDLSWEGLHRLGEVKIYDRTTAAQILERSGRAEIVLTNKTPLSKKTLEQLPQLKYIGVLATGYDVVDVRAAAERGIVVTNVPSYGTDSVAQFVFALILELAHRTGLHSDSVHRGDWGAQPDFCYWRSPLVELSGKTLGVIGLGRIGQRTAEIAAAFGMKVKAYSRRWAERPPEQGITWCSLEELLRTSDVVSLHCPLTDDTRGLIDRERLAMMKPGAYLINTSRGALVVEHDLAEALRSGRLGGAALDVLPQEPPAEGSPLLGVPNCILTPHIAWATAEARSRLLDQAVANVERFLTGTPIHVVSNVSGK